MFDQIGSPKVKLASARDLLNFYPAEKLERLVP